MVYWQSRKEGVKTDVLTVWGEGIKGGLVAV